MRISLLLAGVSFFLPIISTAQYKKAEHRKAVAGEVQVTSAGSFATPGTRYILMNDISADRSAIFLGKNIELDLNGYIIYYANAGYEHIPNSGFEEGLKHWDVSKAPGASLENTADVHVFLGEKLLSLQQGDEIRSMYINLPVANRSYFAICGITGRYYHDPAMKGNLSNEMKLSIYVEDEQGNEVKCVTRYGDTTQLSCPVEKRSPRLGGGFVYAHLTGLPAGRYRVRVKADTDCLVDEIDIRPAMDVGVSIIENTVPLAHYDHLVRESYPPVIPSFFDYTEDMKTGKPLASLPAIEGSGTTIIKNGIIQSGFAGIQSWGIQSSASHVKIILDNVQIIASGISSGAADISWADIKNCRFDVTMPFVIQRHVSLCAVIIRGQQAAEVSHSEFYGGQGCLSIHGKRSQVHHNLFVNHQTVTNHYSIMGTGDSSKIYENRFEPKQGSGIYVSKHTEVFNNTFKIATSPPTCEYGREEYSVAAVRLGDYGAAPGSSRASVGNKIYNNKIYITAKDYPQPKEYIPMAWGIYYSASGGENYVYNNSILVNKTEPSSKALTAAFYICGGPKYFGGQFYDNKITTNVPAAWIASMYGGASNTRLYNNTISSLNSTSVKTFRIGWKSCETCVAKNVKFSSNKIIGGMFDLDVTDQLHSYTVSWTYNLKVVDIGGNTVNRKLVTITDRHGKAIVQDSTGVDGMLRVELEEYSVEGNQKRQAMPYTVKVGEKIKELQIRENTDDVLVINSISTLTPSEEKGKNKIK